MSSRRQRGLPVATEVETERGYCGKANSDGSGEVDVAQRGERENEGAAPPRRNLSPIDFANITDSRGIVSGRHLRVGSSATYERSAGAQGEKRPREWTRARARENSEFSEARRGEVRARTGFLE